MTDLNSPMQEFDADSIVTLVVTGLAIVGVGLAVVLKAPRARDFWDASFGIPTCRGPAARRSGLSSAVSRRHWAGALSRGSRSHGEAIALNQTYTSDP